MDWEELTIYAKSADKEKNVSSKEYRSIWTLQSSALVSFYQEKFEVRR